ncbi:MAG: site-specific integrase [Mycobacteriales bacterium]
MTTSLPLPADPNQSHAAMVDVGILDEQVAAALRAALAPNTWRAYAADWRHWSAWADVQKIPALPARPLDLARYLVAHAPGSRVGTLTRRLSAIAKAHVLAGQADPTDDPAVREVLRGLRREHGTAHRGAPPLWTSDVERIIDTTYTLNDQTYGQGYGTAEVRDRALVLLGFTSALRRSELAALDTADLEPDPAGLIVHVRHSKTDTAGEGAYVGIPYASRPRLCAVLAAEAWIDRLAALLGVTGDALTGPLFRPVDRRGQLGSLGASRRGPDARLSDAAVRDALIRRAKAAGLSPAHGERFFTAHSTRSGFATQAVANGASERAIMDQGRWRSLQVARSYIRRSSVFTDNAAGRLGL